MCEIIDIQNPIIIA